MTKEETIYKIIFPRDDDPNYINYGHFMGKNKMNLYKFKAIVNESQLNPVLIMDGENKNAFYVEVFQSELDGFLELTDEFNLDQIKMNNAYVNEVKLMFKDYLFTLNSKRNRFSKSIATHKYSQSVKMCGSF